MNEITMATLDLPVSPAVLVVIYLTTPVTYANIEGIVSMDPELFVWLLT